MVTQLTKLFNYAEKYIIVLRKYKLLQHTVQVRFAFSGRGRENR